MFLTVPSAFRSDCFYFFSQSDFFFKSQKSCLSLVVNRIFVLAGLSLVVNGLVDILFVMPLYDAKFCLCAD